MSAITKSTLAVGQANNWPNVDKVAFWKEENLAMKIAKIFADVVLIPIAFVMDLVNKAVDYIWPPKKIQPEEKITWAQWIKGGAIATLNKTKEFYLNHKKSLLIYTSIGIVAAGISLGSYYLAPKFGAWICSNTGYFCPQGTETTTVTGTGTDSQYTGPIPKEYVPPKEPPKGSNVAPDTRVYNGPYIGEIPPAFQGNKTAKATAKGQNP